MSDLNPAIMDQFYMKDGVSAVDVTRVSRHHQRMSVYDRKEFRFVRETS